jgi:hypothetical protein
MRLAGARAEPSLFQHYLALQPFLVLNANAVRVMVASGLP